MAIDLPEIGQVDWGGELNAALTQLDAQTVVDVDREGDNLVFVKNNGEREDLGDFRGPEGPQGPQGPSGEGATDEEVSDYIRSGGPTSSALTEFTGIVDALQYGVDPTGATDSSGALQAALDDAPSGAKVRVKGDILIQAQVQIPSEKALTLDFTDSTVIVDVPTSTASSAFFCRTEFDRSYAVSAITSVQDTVEDEIATLARLTVTGDHGWSAGDLIRVVSDDVIPGGHYTNDVLKPRMGEYATIHRVSGSFVYLRNTLFEQENYTQNIRAARLPFGTFHVEGGRFDVPDSFLTNDTSCNVFRGQNLVGPTFRNMRFIRLVGMGVSVKSCMGYLVDQCECMLAKNKVTAGVLGYGVHDSSCQDGIMRGGLWRSLRHPWTDGTNFSRELNTGTVTLETDNVEDHGRTLNTKIQSVTSRDCTAGGFDTHHMSYGVEFNGCTSVPASNTHGFQLRGYGHKIINCTVYGGYSAVRVFTQGTSSGGTTWSYGLSSEHTSIGLKVFGSLHAFSVANFTHSTHPNYNSTDTQMTLYASDTWAKDISRIIETTNGNVEINGGYFALRPAKSGSAVSSARSKLNIRNIIFDASQVTSITGTTYASNIDPSGASGSICYFDNWALRLSSTYMSEAPTIFNVASSSTSHVTITNMLFENWNSGLTIVNSPAAVATQVSWRQRYRSGTGSSRDSSSALVLSNADAVSQASLRNLIRSVDAHLVLTANITDSTARTFPTLPAASYDGQSLSIMLGSATATLTIPHGSTYNTRMSGGVDKVLSGAGAMAHMVWIGGAWREV